MNAAPLKIGIPVLNRGDLLLRLVNSVDVQATRCRHICPERRQSVGDTLSAAGVIFHRRESGSRRKCILLMIPPSIRLTGRWISICGERWRLSVKR